MPSQKFERAVERAMLDTDGALDGFYARLQSGESLTAIAKTLSVVDPKTGVARAPDRATVRRVLNNSEKRRAQYAEARKESAEANVDTAREKLETAPETREGIAKARELASHLRWEAAKKDREQFGDQPMQVNVHAGHQFILAALRPTAVPPPKPEPRAVDAEVIEALPAPAAKVSREEMDRTSREHEIITEAMKMGLDRASAVRFAVSWIHAHPPARTLQRVQDVQEEPDD